MVRFSKITVVLLDSTTVVYKQATFLEVVKQCLSYPLINRTPILIKISDTHKFYFHTNLFKAWVDKEIDFNELLEQVKIDDLARNKADIAITQNKLIPFGALWLVKQEKCILADDDFYHQEPLDHRFDII